MNEPVIKERQAVEINDEYCSRCTICSSLCPYEALRKDPETNKIFLEIEKCQVCGICYSTCPAKAIVTSRIAASAVGFLNRFISYSS